MGIVSHDQQTGAPRDFTLGGRTFPVSGLTPYQLGQLEAHLRDAFPSPMQDLKALLKDAGDAFTPEERKELLADAKAGMEPQFDPSGFQTGGWPVTFNSRQAQQHLFAGRGIGLFLWVVLSKHTPGLSRKEAEELAVSFTASDLAALTELLQVREPDDSEAAEPDDEPDPELPVDYVDPKG